MKFLITGGAGFIGSAVARHIIENTNDSIIIVDKLTYAGNFDNLETISNSARYKFEKGDMCDRSLLDDIFSRHQPDIVIHLAAESHVDTSINKPEIFIQTNIVGTFNLLEVSRNYWLRLHKDRKKIFRLLHVSTDEVFGDLDGIDALFNEKSSYHPSSPYSASKAGSDHLVRAWGRTYNLPVIVTNCSNNYGPYQFPEKLIPLIITNALSETTLPIYGNGLQVRDWLYVEDHARALYIVATNASVGQTYNVGGHNEIRNIDVVYGICDILEELVPRAHKFIRSYRDLIRFVDDRPGHDKRYAIDATKISRDLGWEPNENFQSGLRKTVKWFVDNKIWVERVKSGNYRRDADEEKQS